jgi:hypothetical protein
MSRIASTSRSSESSRKQISSEAPEETDPTDTLISQFWSLEVRVDKFLLF